jgi:hypothetical protein
MENQWKINGESIPIDFPLIFCKTPIDLCIT